MPNYSLSAEAEADLKEIYKFSTRRFGRRRARPYAQGIGSRFDLLAEQPEIGRRRTEIRLDIRSLVYQSHVIFYKVRDSDVVILRILHGPQEPGPNLFEKDEQSEFDRPG